MLLVLSQLAEAIVIDDKDYKAEFVTNTVDANGCTPTEIGGVITIKEDNSQMLDDEDRINAFVREYKWQQDTPDVNPSAKWAPIVRSLLRLRTR